MSSKEHSVGFVYGELAHDKAAGNAAPSVLACVRMCAYVDVSVSAMQRIAWTGLSGRPMCVWVCNAIIFAALAAESRTAIWLDRPCARRALHGLRAPFSHHVFCSRPRR
jgi:hypothetical protein